MLGRRGGVEPPASICFPGLMEVTIVDYETCLVMLGVRSLVLSLDDVPSST